jgi:hypothetical protein
MQQPLNTMEDFPVSDDVSDEPLFALSEADAALLNSDKAMLNFVAAAIVTEDIRRECKAELEKGRECGWKISK